MANIFEFPLLNPLRAIEQKDNLPSNLTPQYLVGANPAFNYLPVDSDFFVRTLKFYEDKKVFVQKFQQSDTIRIQWLGYDGTLSRYQFARLLDKDGNVFSVKTITVVKDPGTYYVDFNGVSTAMVLYYVEINLYDVPEGIYFLQTAYYNNVNYKHVIFEPFNLKQIHPNTSRVDSWNSYNDQGMIYPSANYIVQLRIDGYVKQLPPDAEFNVYIDQPHNKELVSGISTRAFEFVFGQKNGAPIWLAEKINKQFLCDMTLIDGVAYTREQGAKLEPLNSDEVIPLSGYKLKIGERYNTSTLDINNTTNAIRVIGNLPQTMYFWVESMTLESTSETIRLGFKGKRNFLDYLNSTKLIGLGYWAENENNKLVFIIYPNQTLPSGTYSLDDANVLRYGLKFSGLVDNVTWDINGPSGNFYAVVWGDGGANVNKTPLATAPSNTTITKTYASSAVRDIYIYFSDANSFVENTLLFGCTSIGGQLAPSMTYFEPFLAGNNVEQFENNLFKYVLALEYVNANGFYLNSYAVNQIIIWIYESLAGFDSSATIDLTGQFLPGAPTNEAGMLFMISEIRKVITTLDTD